MPPDTTVDAAPQRSDAVKRARRAVLAELRAAHGVMRVSDLYDAGHTRRTVRSLCDDGWLLRPRRGWVARPKTDQLLVTAATHGVVVTCITEARRLGLWVGETTTAQHFGAHAHSGRVDVPEARVHWGAPLIPRPRSAVVDPIENVLAIVAKCQPYEQALAIWESALRKDLVQTASLERYKLAPNARRLLAQAQPWSDSGLETFVVPRLRWLRLELRRQIWILGHRVDLLIGDKLVLQIDGGTHVGVQREQDIAHDALLRLHGYHVIRVGYRQVMHRWPEVQDLIMRAVAQGLHR